MRELEQRQAGVVVGASHTMVVGVVGAEGARGGGAIALLDQRLQMLTRSLASSS